MIIAVDGPAASGKGTLGKRLAAQYGLRHLDTGLIYRAVAKSLLDAGHSPESRARAVAAAEALDPETLDPAMLKRQLVGDLMDRAFGGSAQNLVMHALAAKPASPEELAEIRRLLDELEGGGQ